MRRNTMAKKKKFYAVRVGKIPGIYESWAECQEQITRFSGAKFESFLNYEDAEKYIEDTETNDKELIEEDLDYSQLIMEDLNSGFVVAFTDGSHDSNMNRSSYGIHLSIPNEDNDPTIESIASQVFAKKFSESNNIVGEVFGVINALDWCLKNEVEKISIYCDYQGLIKWEDGSWDTKSEIAKFYVKQLAEYKDMLDIKITWVRGHSNILQNEEADSLAKRALNRDKQILKTGKNYFTGHMSSIDEVDSILQVINTEIEITIDSVDIQNGIKKTIKYKKEKLHVTFYNKSGKLLVQGTPGYIYSMFLSFYTDTLETFNMVRTYSDAYESTIETKFVEKSINDFNLPTNYPTSYRTLIKQSLSLLEVKDIDEYDYGHYTVPAYRALEGNMRYLCEEAGVHINERFSIGGNFKNDNEKYELTNKKLKEHEYATKIEECYNHYFVERHPQFHTGEIGIIDETKMVSSLEDAKAEIQEVLELLKF